MSISPALVEYLSRRCDGPWELLATAAGVPESVSRTKSALSTHSLAATFEGEAISPSLVEARVEAIAAFDPRLLARLAADWPHPSTFTSDPMDAASDFLVSAWLPALRFLSIEKPFDGEPSAWPVRLLNQELSILGAPARPPISWAEVVEGICSEALRYEDARTMDATEVTPDGEHALLRALGPENAVEHRCILVRLMRGHCHDLSEMTIAGVTLLFRMAMDALPQNPNSPSLASLLGQLLVAAHAIPSDARGLIERAFDAGVGPQMLAPVVYPFLASRWQSR